MAALRPSWASEIASLVPVSPRLARDFRNALQKVSASDGPMCSPTISRRPSVFTATATIAATETIRPPSRTLRSVASSQRQGHSPSRARPRKAPTLSSMVSHGPPSVRGPWRTQSLETLDFEMPLIPMACTSSSSLRVETPAIQACLG